MYVRWWWRGDGQSHDKWIQQTSAEKNIWLGGEGDLLGIVPEIEYCPNELIVCTQCRICLGEWGAQTPLRFWDTNRPFNFGQTTRSTVTHQKKTTC